MPRWIRSTLALGAVMLYAAAGHAGAQAPPTLTALYAEYMAGDYQAIARAFPNAQALQSSRSDIQRTLRDWSRSWQPSRSAFLLELSFTGFERQWEAAAELLAGTRDQLVNRRAAPGTNADEDAFELAFHRAAVTFFLGRQALQHADAYVTALAGRVDLVPATSGKPRLVDPWMTFARGLIAEIQTAPALRTGSRSANADAGLGIPAADAAGRRHAEMAIGAFERVRDVPEVAAEASARRALMLIRLDRAEEALVALDEADAAAGDDMVRYWTALFRGRALEQLGRQADAAAAYERAVALVPGAQVPAVALASLWQRHDRPDDALRWARRAMQTPAGGLDPWWIYWRGDLRRASDRLAAIRKGRP